MTRQGDENWRTHDGKVLQAWLSQLVARFFRLSFMRARGLESCSPEANFWWRFHSRCGCSPTTCTQQRTVTQRGNMTTWPFSALYEAIH
jgi:hypothetical protein